MLPQAPKPDEDQSADQPPPLQGVREDRRDDQNRSQIIDDRQREQEGPQAAGHVAAGDGQHRQGEGDVGRHGDRPAVHIARLAGRPRQHHVRGYVYQGGYGHSECGGHDRHQRIQWPTQRTLGQLSFELQAGDEEEDRQQAVTRPMRYRQRPQIRLRDRLIRLGADVGPRQRENSGSQHDQPADRVVSQYVGQMARVQAGCRDEGREAAARPAPQTCRSRGLGPAHIAGLFGRGDSGAGNVQQVGILTTGNAGFRLGRFGDTGGAGG